MTFLYQAVVFAVLPEKLAVHNSPAYCQDEHHDHHDHHEHHAPHVHGEVHINMAMDKNQLSIEMDSAAGNFFGFEGIPKTQKQKDIIKKVSDDLRLSKNIIQLKGGDCHLSNAKVLDGLPKADKKQTRKKEDHHHKHGEKDHEYEKISHNNIRVTYFYVCNQPKGLEAVTLVLFKHYSSIYKVHSQWVMNKKQSSKTSLKKDPVIRF